MFFLPVVPLGSRLTELSEMIICVFWFKLPVMKDSMDTQTQDFISLNDEDKSRLELRREREQGFMSALYKLQEQRLSKTDVQIFWFILTCAQKRMAADSSEDNIIIFDNFDIDIKEISEAAMIAVPNIHRSLRKLEKSFLIKNDNNKYRLRC